MRALSLTVALAVLLLVARPAHAYNHNLKLAGMISTFVGAGLFVTGLILIGVGYGIDNPPAHTGDAGIAFTVMGAIGMGVGIPLWIIGASGGSRAMLYPAANGFLVRY
jgi:hypothetical protein